MKILLNFRPFEEMSDEEELKTNSKDETSMHFNTSRWLQNVTSSLWVCGAASASIVIYRGDSSSNFAFCLTSSHF